MKKNTTLPNHIAIIMDGNRRWARDNKLKIFKGHEKVATEGFEKITDHCIKRGIPYLTLWAFSTENWNRSQTEVDAILNLMRTLFIKGFEPMIKKNVRFMTIGDTSRFPEDIQEGLEKLRKSSENNKKITVTLAINYGGRNELARVVKKMLEEENLKTKTVDQIEEKISQNLDTNFLPDPDLIIRTGGEQRLSGFLPWQSVYSELYFTDVLMPDFNEAWLDKALEEYQQRERRFGH